MMDTQAACWNRGDLAGFVDLYTAEAPLTFLSGQGITRGRADLLAKYQRSYPDAASRGTLRFGLAHMQPLGADHALVLGTYRLDREQPAGGWFTLVVQRDSDGVLRITHDHTSASEEGGLPPVDHP